MKNKPLRAGALAFATALAFVFSALQSYSAVPVVTNPELITYESARALEVPFEAGQVPHDHGWSVTERDASGRAMKATLTILVDNPNLVGKIAIVGPFNGWGKALRPSDVFAPIAGRPHLYSVTVTNLEHGSTYRISIDGKAVLDPSASMYTTREYAKREGWADENLYSIFWDVQNPNLYQMQVGSVDISGWPNLIGEVELQSLAAKFRAKDGQVGPRTTADTYRFVAESGVVEKLKEAGYVAIEMLPFNQSVDGDSWHLRYQTYGLFAPDSRYGNPSEFKMMIDAFHRNGMAVIMDSVVSHWPYHGNQGERELAGIGMDQWKRAGGDALFVGPKSPWGTYRFTYANPHVSDFLIDSVAHMMTEYRIDGLRMDNIDGIIETQGGAEFLKRLIRAARTVNPRALIIAESFADHGKLLHSQNDGGWGFNTKTDWHNFDIWKDGLQGSSRKLQVAKIGEYSIKLWDWNEGPIMRYITNHDESANVRTGFTGRYPASLLRKDKKDVIFGKIKASDSVSMLAGAYHVSLPQARMMQEGSFYSNASVDWDLASRGQGRELWNYFSRLSNYILDRRVYFNFRSLSREIANHVDRPHAVVSFKRKDPDTGKTLFVLINLSADRFNNYAFSVDRKAEFGVGFDSELPEFGGDARLNKALRGRTIQSDKNRRNPSKYALVVPVVDAYSVTIFEEK